MSRPRAKRRQEAQQAEWLAEIYAILDTKIGQRAANIIDMTGAGLPEPVLMSCEVRETLARLRWLTKRA